MMDHPDYQAFASVLQAAYDQAATGKGAERHARGNPFHKQHMQSISTLLNSDKGMAYQAIKKLTEGLDFTDPDRRERELLGVIVYVAGLIVWHREHATKQHEQESRVAVAIDKLASHAGQAGQFKPSDLFKPDSNGEIGTVVEGGLRRQIYRDGRLVEDVIVPMPTQQGEDGRFFVDCSDCGAPEGELHYVLCPRLPVPEAHAEAVEAAFAEQAQFDEARADIIGQNGNDGEHYKQPVDVNDWRTWQVGDVLECAIEVDEGDESTDKIAVGERCEVLEVEPPEYKGALPVRIQGVDYVGWPDFEDYAAAEGAPLLRLFRFHHRPAKTDE